MNGIQFQWKNASQGPIFPVVYTGDFITDRPPYPVGPISQGPVIHLVPLETIESNSAAENYRCYYSSALSRYESLLQVSSLLEVTTQGPCKLSTYQIGSETIYLVTYTG